jgi:small subunit ribosomal protein S4e
MARGNKKHLKRLFAPKDWMLSKLTGVFAPRPRAGAHKIREALPLLIILRNRLKYALNAKEARMILRQGFVKVDSRARSDPKYSTGFQDVIEIPKTGDRFRILYDVKGRFSLVKIGEAEAAIKLCKITNIYTTTGRVPVVTTHDGRRIRYADPKVGRRDTVIVDTKEGKITDVMKFAAGKIAMITGGANRGRIGKIVTIEAHPGAFDIVHLVDKNDHEFATRGGNVFVIGQSYDSIPITLPREKGLKTDLIEERTNKLVKAAQRKQQQSRAGRKVRK